MTGVLLTDLSPASADLKSADNALLLSIQTPGGTIPQGEMARFTFTWSQVSEGDF